MRVRLQDKSEPNNYTEKCVVNAADSEEHEGYAKASRLFNWIWKERDSAQSKLLEAILYKDNLNRAYKRVKANKGAAGIDGITIEKALPYLKEQEQEFVKRGVPCIRYADDIVLLAKSGNDIYIRVDPNSFFNN